MKMMKHIKKKYLVQESKDFMPLDHSKEGVNYITVNRESNERPEPVKDQIMYIGAENFTYTAMYEKYLGKGIVLPFLDPVLAYFHNAQQSLARFEMVKKDLIPTLEYLTFFDQDANIHLLYELYSYSCNVVINLYSCLEAFNNSLIPMHYEYKRKKSKCIELYSRDQIFENIPFKEKMNIVVPDVCGRSIFKKDTKYKGWLDNLIEFRHDVIHLKPDQSSLKYGEVMKKILKHKYNNSIQAVAFYMNFYKPNYIEECTCGVNWSDMFEKK